MSDADFLKNKLKELGSEQKIALLKKLAEKKNPKIFSLSPIQELFYFHHQVQPTLCNVPVAINIQGHVDRNCLNIAINQLVTRHESLRTSMLEEANGVKQQVNPVVDIPLEFINLSLVPAPMKKTEARNLMGSFFYRPFHFHEKSLFRALLIQLNSDECILTVCIHHIVMDGWSLGIIVNDLIAFYEIQKGYHRAKPSLITRQYSDYVAWQQQDAQQQLYKRNIEYWRKNLEGANTILQLPTDFPRPTVRLGYGDTKTCPLSLDLSRRIRAFARQSKSTLFMFFLSCFAIFLNRYTRETDILIGSPVSVRDMELSEEIVGVFLNFLVFRIKLQTNDNFQALISHVRTVALQAYQHQQCSFSEIINAVKPKHDPSFTSLFQVFLAHNNAPLKDHPCADLLLSPILDEAGGADADLALFYSDAQEQLTLRIEYSTELFSPATIDAMFLQLEQLITEILLDDCKPICQLKILPPQAAAEVLALSKYQPVTTSSQTIFDLLNDKINKLGSLPAIIDDNHTVNYNQIPTAVNQIIDQYRLNTFPKGENVLVLLDNSVPLVLVILSLLTLGLRYIPIDRCINYDRLQEIVKDSKAVLIISDRTENDFDIPIISLKEKVLSLNLDKITHSTLTANCSAEDIAYLIYTSGSTGIPKASLNTHAGLYARMNWWATKALQSQGRGITTLAHSFDVSLLEIFGNLLLGNNLYCVKQNVRTEINLLANTIIQQNITLMVTVPQILQLLLERNDFQLENYLKDVVLLGDVITKNLVQAFYTYVDGTLYNSYGPSEACIFVTFCKLARKSSKLSVPIGEPVAQSQIFILNENNMLQPINVPGELCITGTGVAKGYLNRDELTSLKFLPSPWHNQEYNLYRTGDLARWLPDGTIEFLGRIDNQIKFNGIRLEMDAIETLINKIAGVSQAVVVLREDKKGDKRLHAFVTAYLPISTSEIRVQLVKQMNLALIPNFFHLVKTMPTNTNGKVDRKLLATDNLDEILISLQKDIFTNFDSTRCFYAEDWQIATNQKRSLSKACLSNMSEQLQIEKSLLERSNLLIGDYCELLTNDPGILDSFLCFSPRHPSDAYQHIMKLKNFTIANTPSYSVNILVYASPYGGLFAGLLKALHAELSNLTFRIIYLEGNLISKTQLEEITGLTSNACYHYKDGSYYTVKLSPQLIPDCISGVGILRSGGTYIISGGLGGIGSALAGYLASKVKCNLVLLTRQKNLQEQQQRQVADIMSLGSNVDCYQIDLANREEVKELAKYVQKKYDKVNGIIHAAGCVNFGLLANKADAQIREVLDPKVAGTIHLYETFQEQDYQFFIVCSSTATHAVTPGIGDYVIANEFLDSFVTYCSKQAGKPLKSIKWGMWRDIGMSTPDKIFNPSTDYLAHYQNIAMTPAQAIFAFEKALAVVDPIIYITQEQLVDSIDNTPDHLNENEINKSYIAESDLVTLLKEIWEKTLNQSNISIDDNFFEIGGHSLLALQLVNRITEKTTRKIKLQDIFAYPTIRSFANAFEQK